MKNKEKILFAIFKNGEHKGNERGIDEKEAIKNYVIASKFGSFINDAEFMSKYSAIVAVENVHFHKSKFVTL